MTCELSSSFSKENRLTGSTQVWAPQTLPVGNFYFGASTKVVPYNDSVYTFVGQPGAQAHWSNTHPARNYDDQGSIFIFKSGSSGFEQEIIIGPSGSANPNQNQPSNYLAINPTSSLGASYFTSRYALFGKSIDAVSSSTGLHFAVAAPGMANYAGRILLFQSSSSGIEMLEDPGEQLTGSQEQPVGATVGLDSTTYSQAGTMKSTGNYSDRSAISYGGYGNPNDAVSVVFDDAEENLYISFYDSLLSDTGGTSTTGGIRLYKSSSLGGIEHLKDITVSSPVTNEQVGSAHQMIISDGKVYIAASGYAIPRDPGQAYLFTYDTSAQTYTEDIYYPASSFSDPDGEVYTENFGTGTPDIVSGSDGIYILQGSGKRHDTDPYTPTDGLGRLYLFKSSSSGISTVSSFTGSNDDDEYGYNFFGGTAQIMSGNSGLVIVSSEYSGALVGPDAWATASPRIWVYETGSNINTSYYIGTDNSTEISNISPTTPTMGRVLDAQISNDGETLHLATSDPTWSGNEGATILYEWGLSGSCSQQQAGEPAGGNTTMTKGIAVYDAEGRQIHKFDSDGTVTFGNDSTEVQTIVNVGVDGAVDPGRANFYTDVYLKDDSETSLIDRLSDATTISEQYTNDEINVLSASAEEALEAEQARAEAAEAANAAAVAAEAVTARAAEVANATAISDEEARAIAAEDVLTTNLAAETVSREDGDANTLTDAMVYTDTSFDDLSGSANTARDVEQARALAAEAGLSADISSEASTARAAEVALGLRIDDVVSNTDPAALDSMTEIVSAFEAADSDLNGAITALAATHTSELADEEARALAAEAAIASDLSDYETSNDAAVAAEIARATAAEGVLTTNLAAEVVSREDGDANTLTDAMMYTDTSFDDLSGSANTARDAEQARAEAAESDLSDAISAEETRALAAEAVLGTDIAANTTAIESNDADIAVLFDRTAGMTADANSSTVSIDDNVMFSVGSYDDLANLPVASEGSVMYWAGVTEGGFVANKMHFYEGGVWYPSPFTS